MVFQKLVIIFMLLISGISLCIIFDKLNLKVTKIVFLTFLVLLLLYFPLFYLDERLLVKLLLLLFNSQSSMHESCLIQLTTTMTATTFFMFLVALIMLTLAIFMFVVFVVVTLKATYKLILVIRDFFKKKPITPSVEIEKFNLPTNTTINGDEDNLYLKFCRLLN